MFYRAWPGEDSVWHEAPDTAWAAYFGTAFTGTGRSETESRVGGARNGLEVVPCPDGASQATAGRTATAPR